MNTANSTGPYEFSKNKKALDEIDILLSTGAQKGDGFVIEELPEGEKDSTQLTEGQGIGTFIALALMSRFYWNYNHKQHISQQAHGDTNKRKQVKNPVVHTPIKPLPGNVKYGVRTLTEVEEFRHAQDVLAKASNKGVTASHLMPVHNVMATSTAGAKFMQQAAQQQAVIRLVPIVQANNTTVTKTQSRYSALGLDASTDEILDALARNHMNEEDLQKLLREASVVNGRIQALHYDVKASEEGTFNRKPAWDNRFPWSRTYPWT